MKCLRVSCWIALSWSTLACSGAADIPSTPDLSDLLASYEEPTAELDATTAAQALSDAPPLQQLAAAFHATEFAVDCVNEGGEEAAQSSGSRLRLQGSITVTSRCPGELDDPVFDPDTNGTVSITIAVAENRIRQSIGGEAVNCVLRGDLAGVPVRVSLDGRIAFDLGRDLGIGQPWSGELLASISGQISINGIDFRGVSARFTRDRFEHLFELPDGSTVVAVLTQSGIRLRDQSGTWLCLDSESCALE